MARLLQKALAGLGRGLQQSAQVAMKDVWLQRELEYKNKLQQLIQDRMDARAATSNMARFLLKDRELRSRAALEEYKQNRMDARERLKAQLKAQYGDAGGGSKSSRNALDLLDKYIIDRREFTVFGEDEASPLGKVTQATLANGRTVLLGPEHLRQRYYEQIGRSRGLDDEQLEAFVGQNLFQDEYALGEALNLAIDENRSALPQVNLDLIQAKWDRWFKDRGLVVPDPFQPNAGAPADSGDSPGTGLLDMVREVPSGISSFRDLAGGLMGLPSPGDILNGISSELSSFKDLPVGILGLIRAQQQQQETKTPPAAPNAASPASGAVPLLIKPMMKHGRNRTPSQR